VWLSIGGILAFATAFLVIVAGAGACGESLDISAGADSSGANNDDAGLNPDSDSVLVQDGGPDSDANTSSDYCARLAADADAGVDASSSTTSFFCWSFDRSPIGEALDAEGRLTRIQQGAAGEINVGGGRDSRSAADFALGGDAGDAGGGGFASRSLELALTSLAARHVTCHASLFVDSAPVDPTAAEVDVLMLTSNLVPARITLGRVGSGGSPSNLSMFLTREVNGGTNVLVGQFLSNRWVDVTFDLSFDDDGATGATASAVLSSLPRATWNLGGSTNGIRIEAFRAGIQTQNATAGWRIRIDDLSCVIR